MNPTLVSSLSHTPCPRIWEDFPIYVRRQCAHGAFTIFGMICTTVIDAFNRLESATSVANVIRKCTGSDVDVSAYASISDLQSSGDRTPPSIVFVIEYGSAPKSQHKDLLDFHVNAAAVVVLFRKFSAPCILERVNSLPREYYFGLFPLTPEFLRKILCGQKKNSALVKRPRYDDSDTFSLNCDSCDLTKRSRIGHARGMHNDRLTTYCPSRSFPPNRLTVLVGLSEDSKVIITSCDDNFVTLFQCCEKLMAPQVAVPLSAFYGPATCLRATRRIETAVRKRSALNDEMINMYGLDGQPFSVSISVGDTTQQEGVQLILQCGDKKRSKNSD